MAATTTRDPAIDARSARDRLLDAADELFYAEGVHVVGIDRVIERAGVAKATLYSTFGSKDALVRAYLERRHEVRKAFLAQALERWTEPRDRLLGMFDALDELIRRPTYRGCAFANASAEVSASSVSSEVGEVVRGWNLALFTQLAAEAGATDPAALAEQLVVLWDGAQVGARLDHDLDVATRARGIAAVLVDAALPTR